MKTLQIDSAHVKGEPGTGYEGPEGGPFECANCEYFNGRSCGQQDMMRRSKLERDEENRPITDPHGCCEYVDRKETNMGTLNTAERKSIPSSEYGLPGSRKYPMPDRAHAQNAKARATQMVKRGKLSKASAAEIRAKANRMFGEK